MKEPTKAAACALLSTCLALISAISPARAEPFAYISSQETDSITVIDTATDTVVDIINFEALGFAVAIDPSGSTFYVASGGSVCGTCISVVDTITNTVVDTIELDHNPIALVVSPDGGKLYAARNETSINMATVTVINTATLTTDAIIELPRSALDNQVNPRTMTLTPDGGTLYVNDFTGQRVMLIDTASNTVSGEIPVNTCPLGMDITRDGSTVYVASFCALAVNIIDTASNTVADTIFNTGDRTAFLAVSPDGTTVYVTNIINDHTVTVIDTATNSIVDTIAVGTGPIEIAVTPDGTKVYVPNRESNSVSVIDTASNAVVSTIPDIVAPNFLGNFIAQGAPPHSLNITAGPSGVPNPVASGAGVELSITALDSESHELTYAWTADCSSWTDDNGAFNDASLRQPIWTAPANETGDPRDCLISVTVEDGRGLSDQGSYSQRVTEVPHDLSITEGPTGDPNPVDTRGTVNFHVAATDNRGHGLNYLWTSNCPESTFNDNTLQQPVWTAPANNTGSILECVITVTVDDGASGLSDEGFFVQLVSSGPTGPGVLQVEPLGDTHFRGPIGGPFTRSLPGDIIILPAIQTFVLENTGGESITATVQRSGADWVSLATSGTGCALGIACIIELDPQETRSITVSTNDQANALALGEYSANILFTNGTNHDGDTARTINLTVEPADDIPPIVIAPDDVTIKAEGLLTDITGKVGEAVAIDNIDGVLQAQPFIGGIPGLGSYGVGEIFIEWRATDSSGNTGNDFQKVTIVDKTPPDLTLPTDKTRVVTTSSQLPVFVNIGEATATDIHDPDGPDITHDAPADFKFPLGETFVQWTAVDWKGNKRVGVQKITVVLQPGDLAGIELIQVSQDLENSVRVIEGKTTLLRAYFESFNGNNNRFSGLKLTASREGQTLSPTTIAPRNSLTSTAIPNVLDLRTNPAGSSRGARSNNLASLASEFILPNDWTTGTVTFKLLFDDFVDVDCSGAVGPVNSDCSITKTFALSEEMQLKMVSVSFTPSDDSSAPFATTTQDLIDERNHILAQFPVSEIQATVGDMPISGILEVGFDVFTIDYDGRDLFDEILDNLDDMRDADSCYETFGDCQRIYYAVATNRDGSRRTAIFDKEDGGTVLGLGQNPGRASAGLLNTIGTSGQEIGHNFGMDHTLWKDEGIIFFDGIGPCDAPVGDSDEPFFPYINNVDGSRRATLGPLSPNKDVVIGWQSDDGIMLPIIDASDTMSYCPETAWPSKFTYHRFWSNILAIFGLGAGTFSTNSLIAESLTSTSTSDTQAELESGAPITFVRGFIHHDPEDEVEFRPFGLLVDPSAVPPPEPEGDFTLQRFDGSGALVDEISFDTSHVDYRLTDDASPIPASEYFSVPFPFSPLVTEVRLLHDGQFMSSVEASEHIPEVKLLFPNGGESLSGDTVTVKWTGRDRDRDELVYNVQFSPDGGSTWETIVVNYRDTSLPVNLNNLPGTDNGMLRVYAKDGFNVAYDTSDGTFTKPNSPPQVSILLPFDNEMVSGEQLLVLKGTSDDREDGKLPDANLSWISDIDGFLGNGYNLNIMASGLAPGEHNITLRGEDSAGASASDNVRLLVFGDEIPPLVIAGVRANPDTIWPVNHKMIPVGIEVDVRSIPLSEEPACAITSITSNEDGVAGDGHTSVDYTITGVLSAEVRAERSGSGTGREYSIHVECTAEEGEITHSAQGVGVVTVPHNR